MPEAVPPQPWVLVVDPDKARAEAVRQAVREAVVRFGAVEGPGWVQYGMTEEREG